MIDRFRSVSRQALCVLLATGGLVSSATSSLAGPLTSTYTTINSAPGAEKSIPQILGNFYLGTFSQVGTSKNYSNGTITATRVDDGTLGTLGLADVNTAGKSDQLWSAPAGTQVSFTVYSTFSSAAQRFGYVPGSSGGTFQQLGTIFGSKFQALGGGTITDLNLVAGETFRWARSSNGTSFQTSKNADNGNVDKMVTYSISGAETPHFVLFFEDGGDGDLNDLAVEVNVGGRYLPPGYAVPVPAMVWPAIASLGGLGLVGIRRRRTVA